jgi:hypothetical protein
LLLLNATISFVEESNADKAIKALAGALAPKCKVGRRAAAAGGREAQRSRARAAETARRRQLSRALRGRPSLLPPPQCMRDGKVRTMDAVDIVPGGRHGEGVGKFGWSAV